LAHSHRLLVLVQPLVLVLLQLGRLQWLVPLLLGLLPLSHHKQ
jgi:hypothetical protein